tara:strand:+ start:366 stop:1403 length:1038 start_codon:yes stop_codon:yes gene_type:complete
MLDKWHKKEKPVFTGITRGIGGFGFGGGGGDGPVSYQVSGGTLVQEGVTSGSYTYYGFTASGALTITGPGSKSFDILVVGGGGSGGAGTPGNASGGGGAGGVAYLPNISLSAGTYPVTVGDGGTGTPQTDDINNKGVDSSFATSPNPYYILAKGGGGGQDAPGTAQEGGEGGSGGGGISGFTRTGNQPSQNSHNSDILNYGSNGGQGAGASPGGWGGGGGAAGAGSGSPAPASGGPGGNGQPFPAFPAPVVQPLIPSPARPSWTPVVGPTGLFGGGGGAGSWNGPSPSGGPGGGGDGDGGNGGSSNSPAGSGGVNYTGGGAGGRGPTATVGYNGGHGIVLLRMTN